MEKMESKQIEFERISLDLEENTIYSLVEEEIDDSIYDTI